MIYSIGHGNKKIDVFLNELNSYNISHLVDVRTSPYSKYNPQFNREMLKNDLEKVGITYVYLGENLGGLPSDRSCYIDGKVDYDLNVAIMCSESKPEECHRSKLIGQELLKQNIPLLHIITPDKTKDQITLMNELTKGRGVVDLFGNETSFTSRKKYD